MVVVVVAIGSLRIQLASGFSLTAFPPTPTQPFFAPAFRSRLSQLSLSLVSLYPTYIQQSLCLLHIYFFVTYILII
jgi:hypothetical protein